MKPTETQLKGIENILKTIKILSHDTEPLREVMFTIINEDLSNIKKDAVNMALDKFMNNKITFEETMLIIHAIIEKDDISLNIPYTPPSPIQPSIPYVPWTPNPDISPYPWQEPYKIWCNSNTSTPKPSQIYAYNTSITN